MTRATDGSDLARRTQLFLTELDGDATPTTTGAAAVDDDYLADEADEDDRVDDDSDRDHDTSTEGGVAVLDANDPSTCLARNLSATVRFGDPEDTGGYDFDNPDDQAGDDGHSDVDATTFFGPAPDADETPPSIGAEPAAGPPRFSKPIVVGFVAVTIVVALGLSAALLAMQSSSTVVSDQATITSPSVQVVAGPPPSTQPPAPNGGVDAPIPFTASSDCPPGSTAAQGVAGTDPSRAWVCVRAGADGQVLTLDLGRPMKVTAISIVPGWVGSDGSGTDQWLQHRVVTRVQWILINGDQRIAVSQNTNDVHGEAVQQMPGNGPDRGILASQITMIVQQTSRAPVDTPAPTANPGGPGPGVGLLDDVLGAPLTAPSTAPTSTAVGPLGGPTADSANGDPADNTFAVSSIEVIGHLPQ